MTKIVFVSAHIGRDMHAICLDIHDVAYMNISGNILRLHSAENLYFFCAEFAQSFHRLCYLSRETLRIR